MRVFITGGSGLIGRSLARSLLESGHRPVILSRRAEAVRRDPAMWAYHIVEGDPTAPGRWQEEVDGCDAVVNLAGHSVFAERWNREVRTKIRESRVRSAEQVAAAIQRSVTRPRVLVQGSAIGYYGPHGDEELDESAPAGTDFLAGVCKESEQAAGVVEGMDVRLAILRTGIVLSRDEGALKVMAPIFKIGPGAPIGSGGRLGAAKGQQWMSWIHIDDIVGLLRLALENADAAGPINGTSPNPVRNAEFARMLSEALRKPFTPWRFFVPVGPPDALLHLMFGGVAEVITTGQKVVPSRAMALGYRFRYPELLPALREIYGRERSGAATGHGGMAGSPR